MHKAKLLKNSAKRINKCVRKAIVAPRIRCNIKKHTIPDQILGPPSFFFS